MCEPGPEGVCEPGPEGVCGPGPEGVCGGVVGRCGWAAGLGGAEGGGLLFFFCPPQASVEEIISAQSIVDVFRILRFSMFVLLAISCLSESFCLRLHYRKRRKIENSTKPCKSARILLFLRSRRFNRVRDLFINRLSRRPHIQNLAAVKIHPAAAWRLGVHGAGSILQSVTDSLDIQLGNG